MQVKQFEQETGWRLRLYTGYDMGGSPGESKLAGALGKLDPKTVVVAADPSNANLLSYWWVGDWVRVCALLGGVAVLLGQPQAPMFHLTGTWFLRASSWRHCFLLLLPRASTTRPSPPPPLPGLGMQVRGGCCAVPAQPGLVPGAAEPVRQPVLCAGQRKWRGARLLCLRWEDQVQACWLRPAAVGAAAGWWAGPARSSMDTGTAEVARAKGLADAGGAAVLCVRACRAKPWPCCRRWMRSPPACPPAARWCQACRRSS